MFNRNRFKIRLELLRRENRQLFAKLVRVSRGEVVKLRAEESEQLLEAAILSGDSHLSSAMSKLVLEVHGED